MQEIRILINQLSIKIYIDKIERMQSDIESFQGKVWTVEDDLLKREEEHLEGCF